MDLCAKYFQNLIYNKLCIAFESNPDSGAKLYLETNSPTSKLKMMTQRNEIPVLVYNCGPNNFQNVS